ncbi:MAG: 16S rRNA (uracil(1498)-N(3))-methyltransferase [Epsilonproteobacteria bacterium]|nr:MAG: 16S rRNA (uracil(1498)-N(3))-methyltransferase [Campylobacterota bacterium]
MNLFYAPNISGNSHTLNREESKHIIRVLRKGLGDDILFTDGKGHFYKCVIDDANPNTCRVKIVERTEDNVHRKFYLHIAIAPTKNINRLEWFLEKSTEIGIDQITPILCSHSERTVVKPDRLAKVLVSAMKQSLKSRLPVLEQSSTFSELINRPFEGEKFIAYIDKDVTQNLSEAYSPEKNALILIGPEGDFNPDEVKQAKQKGFLPVSLGSPRLRTETAGIVACHTINLINQ